MLDKLSQQIIHEYQKSLESDPENTDVVFFMLDDVAAIYDLSESDFDQLCKLVEKELK